MLAASRRRSNVPWGTPQKPPDSILMIMLAAGQGVDSLAMFSRRSE